MFKLKLHKCLYFWGYLHTESRKIQVKRYFSEEDIIEANASPFCDCVTGPIVASNIDEAKTILMRLIIKEEE